ncbi:hypothetical protein [Cryptosporangium sp. NPDC048952]
MSVSVVRRPGIRRSARGGGSTQFARVSEAALRTFELFRFEW